MAKTIDECEIVVIGGGIIGCFIAYYLSKAGKNVVLLEKKDLGSGASGANDAMVMAMSKLPGPKLAMAMKCLHIWGGLTEELGLDIEFDRHGSMIILETEEEIEIIRKFSQSQVDFGLDVKFLDWKETHELQPALADHVLSSAYCPHDGEVNPFRVLVGLARNIRRLNSRIYTHTPVDGFWLSNGQITHVLTERGRIRTDQVVCAAGAYSPYLGRLLDLDIPIRPNRGQILITESIPRLMYGTVGSGKGIANKYRSISPMEKESTKEAENESDFLIGMGISQTRSGNIVLGVTYEFAGYDVRTTTRGLAAIATNTSRVFPAFKELRIIRTFAGLRPFTEDGLPIVGPVNKVPNFIIVAGHYGDGVCLSPGTGQEVCQKIIDGIWPAYSFSSRESEFEEIPNIEGEKRGEKH